MNLDAPERLETLKNTIARKPALRSFYSEVYARFAACLARCPQAGKVLELGSGGGFARQVLPDLVTSDVIPYADVDAVIDAREMPFADASLRAILMFDVFHHIPDVARFLAEAERCLVPHGRVLMVEPHRGLLSTPILKYLHHEGHDAHVKDWSFVSDGPLSSANTALPWVVFQRDRAQFERRFPKLKLVRYEPHSPLRYWLSGGLKSWSLLPEWAFSPATQLDRALSTLHPNLGSFVDIELSRAPT
jgi:SAM-dependent methyltransferase